MDTHTEQEWQFAADGLESTRAWIAQQPVDHSQRRFRPRTTVELSDTYFDSSDWRIFRAGFALRLRHTRESEGAESSELTLKSLDRGSAEHASRIEFSEPVSAQNLPDALAGSARVAQRIRTLVGERALAPLFRAHTRRERQQLLEADTDLPLAEVDLDQTSIEAPGGATRELIRIEVECMNAEPGVLEPLVQELRDAARLTPAAESKFRAGLAVAGLAPEERRALPKRDVSAQQPFAASQAAILGRFFSQLRDHEPQVRAGSAEAVHQMRVAARHLDVLLKSFASRGPAWAVRSRAAVRTLVKSLGGVRDCDVQIAYLDEASKRCDDAERRALAPVRERLVQQREVEREELMQVLESSETHAWMERWFEELAKPDTPAAPTAASAPTAKVARKLIREQARKLCRRADRIDEKATPDEFHEVRIRAKRLRYTLDAFAPLYGEAAAEYQRVLAKLQTLLGEYHDASVRAEHFRALAAGPGQLSPTTSFELGRLVESGGRTAKEYRARFAKAYRRIRRRRWRAFEAEMLSLDVGAQ